MAISKLFPPILDNKIPAFYSEQFDDNNKKGTIIVPFSMNKSVNKEMVKGFALKISNNVGEMLTVLRLYLTEKEKQEIFNEYKIEFSYLEIEEEDEIGVLREKYNNDLISFFSEFVTYVTGNDAVSYVGTYLKFQLAYIYMNEEEEYLDGYYSTTAVGKLTSKPDILIESIEDSILEDELEVNLIPDISFKIMCSYTQLEDVSERLSSSYIAIYSDNNDLLYKSEEKTHNSSTDTSISVAKENFFIDYNFEYDNQYSIVWYIKTINEMELQSVPVIVRAEKRAAAEDIQELKVYNDFENGCIILSAVGSNEDENALRQYRIVRKINGENAWKIMYVFGLQGKKIEEIKKIWTDFTVEQGIEYIYGLQKYENGFYTGIIESEPILADYEYLFLSDSTRQLKIKYNSKISTFKPNILETKIDTIGGKFPFIFKNGIVNYKEFSIEGLISYLMDEDNLFSNKNNNQNITLRETTPLSLIEFNKDKYGLNSKTITLEREFKLEVLDWLTNGKEKLYRSSTEGNYIIQLINISLSPKEELGRMLHSFSSTGYETKEYNYSNLKDMGYYSDIVDNNTYIYFQPMRISPLVNNEVNNND